MASRLQDVNQRGTRALQPLATLVASGTQYYVTDEFVTERASDTPTGMGGVWENISDIGIPGPPVISQTSFLISGGQVAWVVDYDFTVSAASYFIQAVGYASPQTNITLTPADLTNDRIDIIIVDNTGTVGFITGTASPVPTEPDYDPGTQLKLALILVPAASVEPVVATNIVYFENAGGPTEWNWTTSGVGFNVNSTVNPQPPATKDIEGTAVVAPAHAQADIPVSTYPIDGVNLLVLWIRSKAAWQPNRGLAMSLRTAGVLQGNIVNINRTGSFGFESATLGVYQQIAIPMSLFGIAAGSTITQVRITVFGSGHGFHIANMYFQEEGTVQPPVGITQTQADARYLQRANNLSDLTDVAVARTNLGIVGGGAEFNAGVSGVAKTIDWNNGSQQYVSLTGNCVFTFTNGVNGASYKLILVQDGTGGRIVTWPANVRFENSTPPTLITVANNVSYATFVKTAIGAGGFLGFATTNPIAVP